MLTLRSLDLVERVNQFLLYYRGLTLAGGKQMAHVLSSYLLGKCLRADHLPKENQTSKTQGMLTAVIIC